MEAVLRISVSLCIQDSLHLENSADIFPSKPLPTPTLGKSLFHLRPVSPPTERKGESFR
jgi:hypothetical protein